MRQADARPYTRQGRVVAVLGPTNTGKTHLAIERMLGHRSGMIGFPLRLLARENYERIVRLKGAASVALITGEERIVPPAPRWYVCTVEAMPVSGSENGREVAFLAVDEIQMCADRERGHIFTDRLLNARGSDETMFLGAETAKPLLRMLVPDAEFIARPRFSTLSYVGSRKITRLPRRSAVVAFSASEVYGIAELVRRQRGGAAVVFGALSPRTRNAQVAMYQNGEVDFLIATDAIGMGLNMDIDQVSFAALAKFDGRNLRRLSAAELGQIAGRAGRHMTDGGFGTTAEVGPLDAPTIDAIENHRFPPLKTFTWRNSDLDFGAPARLLDSLEMRPPRPDLIRMRTGDDHLTLAALAKDAEVMDLARDQRSVMLLWEACRIPDYRKTLSDSHTQLVGRIFRHLRGPTGRIPEEWVAGNVARLDRIEGDIDTLLARIAQIRTWTYVAHRPAWLAEPAAWQERTRAVEDKLSDALHERLMQRFVDRRAAVLARKLNASEELLGAVTRSGEVLVEGQYAGKLEGFRFTADAGGDEGGRALVAAANRALRRDLSGRVRRLESAPDSAFTLDPLGRLVWEGHAVARLGAGDSPMTPRVDVLPADLLEPAHREIVRRRLTAWLDAWFATELGPLHRLATDQLAGPARGIAFELRAALGAIPRARAMSQAAALTKADRRALAGLGIVLGRTAVFMPALDRPAAIERRALLWQIHHDQPVTPWAQLYPEGPPKAIARAGAPPGDMLAACGYLGEGPLFVRVSALERLAGTANRLAEAGPFAASEDLARLVGAAPGELAGVLVALGYRAIRGPAGVTFVRRNPRQAAARQRRRDLRRAGDPASPFAALGRLIQG